MRERNLLSIPYSYQFQNEGVGENVIIIQSGLRYDNNFHIFDSVWSLSVNMCKVFAHWFEFLALGDFSFSLSRLEGTGKERRVEEHNILSKEPIVYNEHSIPPLVLLCSLKSRNQVSRTKWTPFLELKRLYKWISCSILEEDNVQNKMTFWSLN